MIILNPHSTPYLPTYNKWEDHISLFSYFFFPNRCSVYISFIFLSQIVHSQQTQSHSFNFRPLIFSYLTFSLSLLSASVAITVSLSFLLSFSFLFLSHSLSLSFSLFMSFLSCVDEIQ